MTSDIVPRQSWAPDGRPPAWTSGGQPRTPLHTPCATLMIHYAGSPDGGTPGNQFLSVDPLAYVQGMFAWAHGSGQKGDEYNYVIAGTGGVVYEWAGAYRAAHCTDWNDQSVGVQFGLDVDDIPPDCYADRLLELRRHLVDRGVLTANHAVDPHSAHFATSCPGVHVLDRWATYDVPLAPIPEVTDVPFLIAVTNHPGYDPRTRVYYVADWLTRRWVENEEQLAVMRDAGLGEVGTVDWDDIATYGVAIGVTPPPR